MGLSGFARHGQIFEVGSGERRGFFPPAFRRQIQIGRTNQVPHPAALVRFFNASPDFVEFESQRFGFVENYPRVRKQSENAPVRARHRSIELPARKNASARVAHRLLHNLRRSRNAFSREPRVDGAEQFLRDRRFRQRQKQRFIDGVRRPLTGRVELAYGLDFIPEKLDPNRPIRFRRVHIQNAAASRILPRHFHHIGGAVADRVQVFEQLFQVERFAATQNPRQVGIVLGRAQKNGGSGHR